MNLIVTLICTLLLASCTLSISMTSSYGYNNKECVGSQGNGIMTFQITSTVLFDNALSPIHVVVNQPIPCPKKRSDMPVFNVKLDCPQVKYTEPDGSSSSSKGQSVGMKNAGLENFKQLWNEHIKPKPFSIVGATCSYSDNTKTLDLTLNCIDNTVLGKLEAYNMNFVPGQLTYDMKTQDEVQEDQSDSYLQRAAKQRDAYSKRVGSKKSLFELDSGSQSDLVDAIERHSKQLYLRDTEGNALKLSVSGNYYVVGDESLKTYTYI